MSLSLNEIKTRSYQFVKEWENENNEKAEAKSFWDAFFNVFGVSRRRVATFEQPATKIDESKGFIDLLWKGVVLVEHKSRGKNLDTAYTQAKNYFPGLTDKELPRYIVVSDFNWFRLYDLDENSIYNFQLVDLPEHLHLFSFLSGYKKRVYAEQDPVNIKAAELMGDLHDALKEIGYEGHMLEVYLVRLLFCLFADDSGIFEKDSFDGFLLNKTSEDGSDLAPRLSELFHVLNTPKNQRFKNLDEVYADFDYINGKLFEESLPPASFDSKMRTALLNCCDLDWGQISPAIFGSLFQSVMNPKERRNLGAHYTSEKNILKLIKGLFLDELWEEFNKVKTDARKLDKFHSKIATLQFLDPACGCGNFLIITYRELRLLEMEIIKTAQKGQQVTDIEALVNIDVDKFYGIEIEDHAVQIATVAMWLMDHQMNQKVSSEFGDYMKRIPLRKSASIVKANALRLDWDKLIPVLPFEKETPTFNYILGNPPFIGSKLMTEEARNELKLLFHSTKGAGVLDYVTGWYVKAAMYMKQSKITKAAFVSTNSISQGEQVGILWGELFSNFDIKIHFAHRTFKWNNEASGVAAVYCVIIGFANFESSNKKIFEYSTVNSDPHEVLAKNINPYLVDAKTVIITSRQNPISNVPQMNFGNMPLDGGNLLLTDVEKNNLILKYPRLDKFIKKLISAKEYINNENRWCIWLKDASPEEIKSNSELLERIEKVKEFRLNSVAPSTRKFATTPMQFRDTYNPSNFILIPSTSSENRKYIPFGFFKNGEIANNSCHIIANGNLFHFGILTSEMHMAWVRYICGRLESRFRYSKDIVYNNYPWPESPTEKQKQAVELAAQKVLDVRAEFPNSSLADLYDPLTMPPALVKAHQALDKAVDQCYRSQPFISETARIEYLFELYDKYTSGLFAGEGKKKNQKRK
jgi:hypothetical protein